MQLTPLILCVSNGLLMVGSYLVWPSRWNIPAHLQLGFWLTAYLIPIFATDVLENASPEAVQLYVCLQCLGTPTFLIGQWIGFRAGSSARPRIVQRAFDAIDRCRPEQLEKDVARKMAWVMGVGVAGMLLSFMVMGFVPAFADDPLTAKFFRGAYQAPYLRVASLFRISYYALVHGVPLALILWYTKARREFLFLGIAGFLLLAATLTRELAVTGVVMFLGLLAARHRRWFPVYLVTMTFLVPLGSVSYYFAGQFLGQSALAEHYDADSGAWEMIASGAPDMVDQLHFLDAFQDFRQWTHGRTFFGGLVPNQYAWNPSVWSLRVMVGDNNVDTSEIVSGGLRLPVTIWGYVSFGFLGTICVSLLSGLFSGLATNGLKELVTGDSLVQAMIGLTLFMTLGEQLIVFYRLSYFYLPGIALAIWLIPWSSLRDAPNSAGERKIAGLPGIEMA